MSIYEYDKEFEEKKLRKAEYEAGRQDGIEIGRQDGIEIGRQAGIKVGEENVLKRFIEKRLRKRMTLEEIAEDLDEDIVVIQKLINDNSEAI